MGKTYFCFICLLFLLSISLISCKNSASGPEQPTEEPKSDSPKISSIQPESGIYGTPVTIIGEGFSTDLSSIMVDFNGREAEVDSAGPTVLYTKVPEEATTGIISVRIGGLTAEGPEFEVITTGAVEVIVSTSGPDQDRDGYVANIDLQKTLGSSLNDTLLFVEVEQGSRRLVLEDLENVCSVSNENPQNITVTAQDTSKAFFGVKCEEVVLKNKIVYERDRGLFMMNPDGTEVKKISESEMDQAPAISPDGRLIATSGLNSESGEENPNGEIYIIDASGYPITPLTNTVRPINSWDPSWSPDGEKILLEQQGNQELSWYDIVVINRDGTGKINLTDNESNDLRASWSPDGTKIAFASDRDNGRMSIFLMDSDGSNITQLTDNTNYDDFPRWSPDGSKIVYLNVIEGFSGNDEIFIMDANGSNKRRLTNDDNDKYSPSWSPDGTEIIFTSRVNDQWDIFKMNTDGTGLSNLTNTPDVNEFAPDWSQVQ